MPPITDKPSPLLWRGLEELSSSAGFEEYFHREFPKEASIWAELENEQSRRDFLKLMGASFALAGIASCTKMPAEKIFSYAPTGKEREAHEPLFFASSSLFGGYAKGILVESHEGRPTKIEGNALHPASLGTSDIFSQAEILSLYDPMRSKAVLHLGEVSTWDAFHRQIAALSPAWKKTQGDGVRILSNTITSPTLAHQISLFLKQFPKAKWHSYDAVNSDCVIEGSMSAFGQDLRPLYYFDRARVILSLDADFLGPNIAQQAYARAFIDKRKIRNKKLPPGQSFNRLYMIDSSVSLTGSFADHRLALKPSQIMGFALALALKLKIPINEEPPVWTNLYQREIDNIAKDLLANAAQCLVIAGEQQTPALHALTHALNARLGNYGKTIEYISPPEANAVIQSASLKELAGDLAREKVEVLLILGANPAYATPASVCFAELMKKAKLKIHLGIYEDETSHLCEWHLPEAHFLESWGDAKAFDGTISFQQPLITPLYDGLSASQVLAKLFGDTDTSSFEILKKYWSEHSLVGASFERALHDGLVKDSRSKPITVKLKNDWQIKRKELPAEDRLEISFRPDPTIWDGRYANNGWLQELPKPILQLCWDNAALLSPKTAERLELKDEDKVELRLGDYFVQAPILIVPGHPDNSLTVHFGYGRTRASTIGIGHGFDAYKLFSADNNFSQGLQINKLHSKWPLARTHFHHSMEGRHIVRRGSIHDYVKSPSSIVPNLAKKPQPSLLPKRPNPRHAWAMVIDLNSCIGCNTCTIACQAENNIPIVGKEEVRKSREMHWIRVDRYFEGSLENPKTFFQPVPCMQCETAPCEVVCPTAATNHSIEGINQMVYNRCVGTRYCSNNCPYKVRRFNFFQFADTKTPSLRLMYNPNVTVRSRGVMEKCTYCIQRIEKVRIQSQKENREIKDGEITPACAQACPTKAIVFGDKNDASSEVTKLRELPLNYSLLYELGTVPRTTYLAKLKYDNLRWKKEV